jgi:hypothetical protein
VSRRALIGTNGPDCRHEEPGKSFLLAGVQHLIHCCGRIARNDFRFSFHKFNGPRQAGAELCGGIPAEQALRPGDIRVSLFGTILWKGEKDYPAPGLGQLSNEGRALQDGKFVWIRCVYGLWFAWIERSTTIAANRGESRVAAVLLDVRPAAGAQADSTDWEVPLADPCIAEVRSKKSSSPSY